MKKMTIEEMLLGERVVLKNGMVGIIIGFDWKREEPFKIRPIGYLREGELVYSTASWN